jgi:murein DD-endopeptidase MepM/ murein hydrolase activator NlpD
VTRKLPLAALVLSLVWLLAFPAVGADLDTDLDRVRDRISDVRSQISSTASDRSVTAKEVLAAADALDAAEREVAAASAELSAVGAALDERRARLSEVRTDLTRQFEALAETRSLRDSARSDAERWALDAYMGGGNAQPSIAFSATAVNDIAVGVAYLDVLTGLSIDAADKYADLVRTEERHEEEIRTIEAGIAAEVAELQGLGQQMGMLQDDLVARRAELALALVEQQEVLDQLDEEIDEFEGELAALEREEASIRRQITAASAPKAESKVQSTSGFVRPVPGAVSSGFGMRVHPITGNTRMHNGVDMNAAHGDPIRAVRSGRVILAGVKGGYGNTIMIDHGGGMVTLYAHQSRLAVSNGVSVSAGEVIGYIGSTGQSTGPHLHFEVRLNGSPVNPLQYF